jgi:hypothetical protein
VSNRLRRVKAECEVNVLNRHVGGQNQFLPGGDFHERSIIANAQADTRRSPRGPALDPGYELTFGSEGRFVTHVIREARFRPTLCSSS